MPQELFAIRLAPLLLGACLASASYLASAQTVSADSATKSVPTQKKAPAKQAIKPVARHVVKTTRLHKITPKAAAAAVAAAEAKPLLGHSDAPPTEAQQVAATDAAQQAVNPIYQMKWGRMECGSHEFMDVKQEGANDQSILITWKGKKYLLARKPTSTGAYHFDDAKAGLVMIQIPAKSMLFDKRNMTRLADDCNPIVASQ